MCLLRGTNRVFKYVAGPFKRISLRLLTTEARVRSSVSPCVKFVSDRVALGQGFPHSLSFHQPFNQIFICELLVPEGTNGRRLGTFPKAVAVKKFGEGRPITGHEGPEGEWTYSSTLFSTSALDGGWVVNATPRPLYPRERPGTHCIGDWVGLRAGLDGCGRSHPHRDSIPRPSSP